MRFWSSSHRLRFILPQTAESRTLAIFLFAALLLVLAIGSVMVSSNSAQKAAKEVARTQRILALLEGFMVDLKDAESNMRGFALTAKEPVADRYHEAVRRAWLRLEDLRDATRDHPTQRILGEHLQQRMEQRIAHMDGAIERAKTQGLAAAQAYLIEGRGLVLMQELEELVRQMREEETRLLSIRTNQWRQSARSALWVFFGGHRLGRLAGFWLHNGPNRSSLPETTGRVGGTSSTCCRASFRNQKPLPRQYEP